MQKMEFILTLIIFLVGAIICLLGMKIQLPWIAPLFVFSFAIVYLLLSKPAVTQVKFILCILIISYTVNSLLKLFGLVSFTLQDILIGQIPLWFFCFLALFAVVFPTLFASVKNDWVTIIIGAISGPLYYYTAHQLGLIGFQPTIPLCLILIAVSWALMIFVFIKLRNSLTHSQTTIQTNH